mgnify:CR=1 FL=1
MEQIIGKLIRDRDNCRDHYEGCTAEEESSFQAEMEKAVQGNSTPSWRNRQKSRLRKFAGILRVRRISACHLREDTQAALSQLDAYYAKNHERLSREIFEKIIQEEVM